MISLFCGAQRKSVIRLQVGWRWRLRASRSARYHRCESCREVLSRVFVVFVHLALLVLTAPRVASLVRVLPLITNDTRQTPLQEAISFLAIGTILVGVGCYLAATHNIPVASSPCFGLLQWCTIGFPDCMLSGLHRCQCLSAQQPLAAPSLLSEFLLQACLPHGFQVRTWPAWNVRRKSFAATESGFKSGTATVTAMKPTRAS